MSLEKTLDNILALEREGRRRLEEAAAEARSVRERCREEAEELLRRTEEDLARERERELEAQKVETSDRVETMLEEARKEEQHLRSLAESNRESALARLLAWLEER